MKCPECGSNKTVKWGFRPLAQGKQKQRYLCKSCNTKFCESDIFSNPKVLYVDIETSPIIASVWKTGKSYINPDFIIQDWFVLCWAAKWLCEDEVFSSLITAKELKNKNDRRVVKSLWNLLDAADIVVGHNVNGFDLKKMNWRFIVHDIQPPNPYKTVDTLKVAKDCAGATSNKLDFLAKQLGLNGKKSHRPTLWQDCMNCDETALHELVEYCKIDVVEGEGVYLKLRPFIKNHPNMGLYYETDEFRCRNCGSTQVEKGGFIRTPAQVYVKWRCKCGAVGRTDERVLLNKELAK